MVKVREVCVGLALRNACHAKQRHALYNLPWPPLFVFSISALWEHLGILHLHVPPFTGITLLDRGALGESQVEMESVAH